MDTISALQELNLSEREAKVYLHLLELGPSIASKTTARSSLNRTLVYDTLNSLIRKGLVTSTIKENVKYFSAIQPAKLLELLHEKERNLREIIPTLESLNRNAGEMTRVDVFSGKEGFKTFMNDLIKEGKTLYGLGYTAQGPQINPIFYNHWQKRRVQEKIARKYLVTQEVAQLPVTNDSLTEIRILPEGLELPSSTIVYGHKTLIFFPQEKELTAILIESKGIAKSHKEFFKLLWKISKKRDKKISETLF
jgi:sugar-specific transcriptional regulator TrmB